MPVDPGKPIMVCRSAEPPEPIDPRYHLGYRCVACGQQLQISPDGIGLAREGANLFCNDCGMELAQGLGKAGKLGELQMLPGATRQAMKAAGVARPEDLFPNAPNVEVRWVK
jgi:DNA-directed RNA polymerase subunit RPC12/RpoP